MDILRKNLQSEGVECYVSQYDEDYGGILPEKLTSAIDDNDIVMVILTKNGSKSVTVNQEIGYAKKAKKRIIPLLGPGVLPLVFLQGIEHESFTPENMDEVFKKISKFVATKIPLQKTKKSNNKSLKETVEQEGIDLEPDNWFIRFVLKKGRNHLMKKYGRLDVPLNREIKILYISGIGLLVPMISLVGWSILFSHKFDPNIMYIEIGLAFLIVPAAIFFQVVRIIQKRRCEKCNSNFGIEISESKQVEKKRMYKTQDYVRMREIQRNTYTCMFCSHEFTRNESKEYNEYFDGHHL